MTLSVGLFKNVDHASRWMMLKQYAGTEFAQRPIRTLPPDVVKRLELSDFTFQTLQDTLDDPLAIYETTISELLAFDTVDPERITVQLEWGFPPQIDRNVLAYIHSQYIPTPEAQRRGWCALCAPHNGDVMLVVEENGKPLDRYGVYTICHHLRTSGAPKQKKSKPTHDDI